MQLVLKEHFKSELLIFTLNIEYKSPACSHFKYAHKIVSEQIYVNKIVEQVILNSEISKAYQFAIL